MLAIQLAFQQIVTIMINSSFEKQLSLHPLTQSTTKTFFSLTEINLSAYNFFSYRLGSQSLINCSISKIHQTIDAFIIDSKIYSHRILLTSYPSAFVQVRRDQGLLQKLLIFISRSLNSKCKVKVNFSVSLWVQSHRVLGFFCVCGFLQELWEFFALKMH